MVRGRPWRPRCAWRSIYVVDPLVACRPRMPVDNQVAGAQEVAEVPDLGPAVVVDQLSVLVWDAYAQGNGDGIPDLLTAARRALA